MLAKAKKKVLVAGNIGNALTEDLELLKNQDWIVAELSSFQLEDIETFRPRVAAVLNVTQDHLDRYKSIAEYSEAKARIFKNQQKGDVLILNFDDPLVKSFARRTSATVIPFSRSLRFSPGAYVQRECSPLMGSISVGLMISAYKAYIIWRMRLAAVAVSICAGADIESVSAVLREFAGLEHRLEFVREKNGVHTSMIPKAPMWVLLSNPLKVSRDR